MSEQMLSLYGWDSTEEVDDSVPFVTLTTRPQVLARIKENRNFDLLILGGGLTGAVLAHEAALQGIKVLLLERGSFGADALSWDVRIMQQLRSNPRELFRARAALRSIATERAPHVVSAMPKDSHAVTGIVTALARRFVPLCCVDERLLIRETILAARQEGASVISAVTPKYLEAESAESGCFVVHFHDPITRQDLEARVGGVVLDPTHGALPPSRLGSYVVPATNPVPAGVQYVYEATPRSLRSAATCASFELSDGSFIAVKRLDVTLLEVSVLWGAKPLASETVQGIIYDAVTESGWDLQREVSQRQVSGSWSRRYGISQVKGVFSCSHRGPWDALRSAHTIVKALVALSREPRTLRSLSPRLLPGGERNCDADAFRALARAQGVSEQTIERVVARWRGRVRYLPRIPNGLREFAPGILRGEVELAVLSDQVTSVDDLVAGALALQQFPEWRESIPVLQERLNAFQVSNEPVVEN
jgi:hypothetical protein